jgi:hypothetical protein
VAKRTATPSKLTRLHDKLKRADDLRLGEAARNMSGDASELVVDEVRVLPSGSAPLGEGEAHVRHWRLPLWIQTRDLAVRS